MVAATAPNAGEEPGAASPGAGVQAWIRSTPSTVLTLLCQGQLRLISCDTYPPSPSFPSACFSHRFQTSGKILHLVIVSGMF